MKRTSFAIFVLAICLSMFESCKTKISEKLPLSSVKKTLNGFDFNKANTYIGNFEGSFNSNNVSQFDIPSSLYTFYSLWQIKQINDLLRREQDTLKLPIDGVRIYLGTSNNISGYQQGVTKSDYHLFLVTTRTRDVGNGDPSGTSSHIDYYDHDASYLTAAYSQPFGDAIVGQATAGYDDGALLFKVQPGSDNCTTPTDHYIDNNTAYKWVQDRCTGTDPNSYNMRSEWFEICFIRGLFDAILDPQNNLSGLRIYLGKGYEDASGQRDVFILYPTQDKLGQPGHPDYYQCVEGLGNYFGNCPKPKTLPQPPANTSSNMRENRAPIAMGISEAFGYDDGELCPNSCN